MFQGANRVVLLLAVHRACSPRSGTSTRILISNWWSTEANAWKKLLREGELALAACLLPVNQSYFRVTKHPFKTLFPFFGSLLLTNHFQQPAKFLIFLRGNLVRKFTANPLRRDGKMVLDFLTVLSQDNPVHTPVLGNCIT